MRAMNRYDDFDGFSSNMYGDTECYFVERAVVGNKSLEKRNLELDLIRLCKNKKVTFHCALHYIVSYKRVSIRPSSLASSISS